ncbi:hypothetical protein [Luteolibacter marinus]|uniref:hypothetical protein n=1 Tax=Luteolibacter marinus TaxID=2776705 RepID=UPI0018663A49|nr:hypothetical protein [Luteolibacter marinus]
MEDPTEEPLYDLILGMVLWGEPEEDILHRLEVNGVTGTRAAGIYSAARSERIDQIRGECARKIRIGIIMAAVAAAIFCGSWFGLRVIPRLFIAGCGVVFGLGMLRLIDGAAGWLMAAQKEGPVSDSI